MTVAEECCPKDSSGKITLGNYLEYTQTMLRALKQVKVHLVCQNYNNILALLSRTANHNIPWIVCAD